MAHNINIDKFFVDLDPYLKISSQRASDFFKMIDYKHEFFKGAIMDISPETCGIIYKELLSELIKKGAFIGQQHGLLVALIPCGINPEGDTQVNVQLGVVFPDKKI